MNKASSCEFSFAQERRHILLTYSKYEVLGGESISLLSITVIASQEWDSCANLVTTAVQRSAVIPAFKIIKTRVHLSERQSAKVTVEIESALFISSICIDLLNCLHGQSKDRDEISHRRRDPYHNNVHPCKKAYRSTLYIMPSLSQDE